MAIIGDNDKFLVSRDGNSYHLTAENFMAELRDDDLMLVNRDGVSYKATGDDIKYSISPPAIVGPPTVLSPANGAGISFTPETDEIVAITESSVPFFWSGVCYSASNCTDKVFDGNINNYQRIASTSYGDNYVKVNFATGVNLFNVGVGISRGLNDDKQLDLRIVYQGGATKSVGFGSGSGGTPYSVTTLSLAAYPDITELKFWMTSSSGEGLNLHTIFCDGSQLRSTSSSAGTFGNSIFTLSSDKDLSQLSVGDGIIESPGIPDTVNYFKIFYCPDPANTGSPNLTKLSTLSEAAISELPTDGIFHTPSPNKIYRFPQDWYDSIIAPRPSNNAGWIIYDVGEVTSASDVLLNDNAGDIYWTTSTNGSSWTTPQLVVSVTPRLEVGDKYIAQFRGYEQDGYFNTAATYKNRAIGKISNINGLSNQITVTNVDGTWHSNSSQNAASTVSQLSKDASVILDPTCECTPADIVNAGWASTDWQIATDSQFTSIAASVSQYGNQTQWPVTPSLSPSTKYFVRARHRAGDRDGTTGPWSASNQFQTGIASPQAVAPPGDIYRADNTNNPETWTKVTIPNNEKIINFAATAGGGNRSYFIASSGLIYRGNNNATPPLVQDTTFGAQNKALWVYYNDSNYWLAHKTDDTLMSSNGLISIPNDGKVKRLVYIGGVSKVVLVEATTGWFVYCPAEIGDYIGDQSLNVDPTALQQLIYATPTGAELVDVCGASGGYDPQVVIFLYADGSIWSSGSLRSGTNYVESDMGIPETGTNLAPARITVNGADQVAFARLCPNVNYSEWSSFGALTSEGDLWMAGSRQCDQFGGAREFSPFLTDCSDGMMSNYRQSRWFVPRLDGDIWQGDGSSQGTILPLANPTPAKPTDPTNWRTAGCVGNQNWSTKDPFIIVPD